MGWLEFRAPSCRSDDGRQVRTPQQSKDRIWHSRAIADVPPSGRYRGFPAYVGFLFRCYSDPKTQLVVIPAKAFLSRLEQRQELATKLFASLAQWQKRLMREIADLKGRSPAQRVGLFLLAQNQSSMDTVRLPMTMAELASRIGITPESLSRVMVRLRPFGITVNRHEVIIGNPEALREFCMGDA